MLDNDQLYEQIPKHVEQWTQQDVLKWFKINNIQIQQNLKISGKQFLSLTPTKIFKELKVSHFLARKISDWIENQVQDFQQYVNQHQKKQIQQKNIKNQQQNTNKIYQNHHIIANPNQVLQLNRKLSEGNYNNMNNIINQNNINSSYSAPKYKSQSGIKQNIIQTQQQYKSQGDSNFHSHEHQNHIKFQIQQQNQDQSTQFYKPMKYHHQVNKNWVKKGKNSQNINLSEQFKVKYSVPVQKVNKKVNKSELVLKQLMQNGQNNQSQIQTYKYLPQDSQYYNNNQYSHQLSQISQITPYKNIIQSQKIKPSPILQNVSQQQLKCSSFYSKHLKLVSSHLILPNYNNVLTAYYNDIVYQINKNITKIGRSNKNDMIIQNQGVSRNHAEIEIFQEEIDVHNNQFINSINSISNEIKKYKRYYLKDIGSKFGTFVNIQPQKPKRVIQNQIYCIGQTIIKITKLKISKNKQKFDMTIQYTHNQQIQKVFLNKSQITIGNSNNKLFKDEQHIQLSKYQQNNQQITKRSKQSKIKDLQLSQDQNLKHNHCRFVYINGDVYFEEVQGTILEKLQPNVKMEFTRHKYQVKFGDSNVIFVFQNGISKIHDYIDDQKQ